jgi:hypothetical protein
MVMIALCSSLIGATLGTRLKVVVLVPAMILGFVLVTAVAAVTGAAVSAAIAAVVVWAIFLQLGYLGGLLTRFCLETTGLVSQRSLHSTIVRN